MLYESFWQELPPTHFVPFRANNLVVKPFMYTFKPTDKAVNTLQTLTVEVSLSRAFIWSISLQMSLLPSESSSDLQYQKIRVKGVYKH